MNFKSRPPILITTACTFMFLLCATPYLSGASAYSPTSNKMSQSFGAAPPSYSSQSCSDCLAGYTIGSASGPNINSVSVKIKIPSVKCSTSTSVQESFFGVALVNSNNAVEAGVGVECSGTSTSPFYGALYVFGQSNFGSASWAPKAGNVILITVSASEKLLAVTIKDVSTAQVEKATYSSQGAIYQMAGCLTVLPGSHPQVNYGRVTFSSCKVNVAGHSGTIGAFSGDSLTQWTSYDQTMSNILAKPSPLSSTGGFTVAYVESGP
jgi:hypothetical protein